MKDNFDAQAGSDRRRDEYTPAWDVPKPYDLRGAPRAPLHPNGHAPAPRIDAWVVLDVLLRRWRWLLLGSLLCGGLFCLLGWHFIRPKFMATAQLLRYETPGASDFFKTTTPVSSETLAGLIRSPDLFRSVGELADPPIPPEKFAKRVKVDPDPDSDMIKVTLLADKPQQAADLLNLYLGKAVEFLRDLQSKQAGVVANQYLKRQVEQMDQDIQALHQEFRGLPSSPELRSMTNKFAEVGTNLNALTQDLTASPRPSALMEMQAERLNRALGELSELLSKYTELHPLVKQKRSEIQAIQGLMSQGSKSGSAPSAFTQLTRGMQPGGLAFNPELDLLTIKMRSLEDNRVQLANRFREAQLYADNPPGTLKIWAPATIKTVQGNLHRVKIGLVTLFGALLGLACSVGLLAIAELADSRLQTADDVKRVTKLPVIGTLGDLDKLDAEARSQWAFRTWMMLQGRLSLSSNHGLVCGITSSAPGEGRSTWVSLLAEAASLTGFRVLTIATQPSPGHVEFKEESPGELLSERERALGLVNHSTALTTNVLSSPALVTDKLTGPNSQPMVHIPLPGWVWNLERRKQWREALNHWRRIDNLVIFVELPPASVPEAVLLWANLPNMVWLANCGTANAAHTRDQLETLRHARCNLVGAVLNRQSSVPVKSRFPRWIA